MKNLSITLIFSALCAISLNAQSRHVQWTYESKEISPDLYEISIVAEPDFGWHIYDTVRTEFGPTATTISFDTAGGTETVGELEIDGKLHRFYDDVFMMEIGYFEGKVVFRQKVRVPGTATSVSAQIEWMACNDANCDRPMVENIVIPIVR